jgi:hypothetical protein
MTSSALRDRLTPPTAPAAGHATTPSTAASFAPRPALADWPMTRLAAPDALTVLMSAPFVLNQRAAQYRRNAGVRLLIDWLADQPGMTWQDRWLSSGADATGRGWREAPARWLRERSYESTWRRDALIEAMPVAVSADLIRPSLRWLITGGPARGGLLARNLEAHRDPAGFALLNDHCRRDPRISATVAGQIRYVVAQILAAKGGGVGDIAVGDLLEVFDFGDDASVNTQGSRGPLYRVLFELGIFGDGAPASLRALRTSAPRTPAQLIDRYHLRFRPIRDLLVDYLRERQPSLDHTSLDSLANFLGKLFWADLEAHHPDISTLHVPVEVADAWKQRLRTITRRVRTASGDYVDRTVERVNYRECLTPVRAFYLDLAHWAVEDPARWGPWVAPSPVGAEEISRKKTQRRLKARMDARTRERLPALPVLVQRLDQRRKHAHALLEAGRAAPAGHEFTVAGTTLTRAKVDPRTNSGRIWVNDPNTAKRRDLTREEDHAFWAWAAVEVLRATGIRVEELVELTHYSLVQYRLPDTGELVPLLQITPSKTDAERLLVVSPDLADVLATIIARVRDESGKVPLTSAYDTREHLWSPPMPFLFQRRISGEHRPIPIGGIGGLLTEALAVCGPHGAGGEPVHYTPHDFRRMFITDAILNGLPPHIAQIIAGHRDINVTLGYKAVYPDEAVQAHLAFLARRRSLRPSEEYRTPTDEEWEDFLGHWQRRKVSIGTCARAMGTPCIHEHACVRCSMLRPEPTQRARLEDIRDNLQARIHEAHREGWLGEVEGLHVSLAGAEDKIAQLDRRRPHPVQIAAPTVRDHEPGRS